MRVAVVGCGFQGRLHLESLERIDGVSIIAVCDTDAARLDEVGEAFGIRHRYIDYRSLLSRHELDLLTICTMPNTHERIALDAFSAGANVFCEKPLALNAEEGRAMLRAAAQAERLFSVGFNMRFMGSAQAVKRLMDEGKLGTPICGRGFMLADDVPWWGKHYVKALSGGGALAATAVHMLDLLIWLVGNPRPTTATASMTTIFPRKRRAGAPSEEAAEAYDVEDLLFGHVRFDNGFWLSIEGSWVWDQPGWNYSFDLVGDRAQVHFDPLRLSGEVDGELVDLTEGLETDRDFPASVERALRDVVGAMRDGREPLVKAEEALVVQTLVDALYRSADQGREVAVEPLQPLSVERATA